jgi:FkbM family methyltransferase
VRRLLLSTVKQVLPPPALERLRLLRPKTWRDARGLAPVRDYVRLLRVQDARAKPPAAPVTLRVDLLQRRKVALRPGTTDLTVLFDTIHGYHLPPEDLDPETIVDLGCNVGLTTAHFATLYERATILGVEPEPSAARLAARNVSSWESRCRIVNAAAWSEDTTLRLLVQPGHEYGARLSPEGATSVPAVSLDTLLEEFEVVDFLKMDIEGAEAEVLARNTDWAAKVRCLKVETHRPYRLEECAHALALLGFRTTRDEKHSLALVARRP